MSRFIVMFNSLDGGAPALKQWPCKASETFSSGYILIDSGDGAEIATVANTAADGVVLGVANEGVTTAAAAELIKVQIDPDIIYEMPFTDAGTKKTFEDADIGTKFQLSSNPYTLDPDVTANSFLELVGYDNDKLVAQVLIRNRKG